MFSTVGAEPRSSWTIPGATVIPNPSVDPGARSWVDPDAVPGVLGPPQANPTSHGEEPLSEAHADRPEGADEAALGRSERSVGTAPPPSGPDTVALGSAAPSDASPGPTVTPPRGETGLVDLARDPRARLAGALVLVVLIVLLVGRIGDLASPDDVGAAPSALIGWSSPGPTAIESTGPSGAG
ncbi:MAG: hypothetical protein R2704_01355 [Microthrixaceae bacterium]